MMASLMKSVAQSWVSSKNRANTIDMCTVCGQKPKFVENGHIHPYCGRRCARNAGAVPSQPSRGSTTATTTSSSPTCLLHGCGVAGKIAFSGFCSDQHAQDGVRLGQADPCNSCYIQPRTSSGKCIPCDRQAGPAAVSTGSTPPAVAAGGPAEQSLRELNRYGRTFAAAEKEFLKEWSTGKSPVLSKVYEVVLSGNARRGHEAYRNRLRSAKQVRTYYSSQCICNMGTKTAELCDFKSCGICCAVKSAFKSLAFGEQFGNGRFGDGFYSYKAASGADRYATSCTTSPYRVMMACEVLVEDGTMISQQESTFVPDSDAIIPVFVLIYQL